MLSEVWRLVAFEAWVEVGQRHHVACLLRRIGLTIKSYGQHLKASAAMVRLRLYETMSLLPPQSYESKRALGCSRRAEYLILTPFALRRSHNPTKARRGESAVLPRFQQCTKCLQVLCALLGSSRCLLLARHLRPQSLAASMR